ncbi:MAG: hypothetical protein V1811_00935 [Candidatus Micrarchaeota archaeon]
MGKRYREQEAKEAELRHAKIRGELARGIVPNVSDAEFSNLPKSIKDDIEAARNREKLEKTKGAITEDYRRQRMENEVKRIMEDFENPEARGAWTPGMYKSKIDTVKAFLDKYDPQTFTEGSSPWSGSKEITLKPSEVKDTVRSMIAHSDALARGAIPKTVETPQETKPAAQPDIEAIYENTAAFIRQNARAKLLKSRTVAMLSKGVKQKAFSAEEARKRLKTLAAAQFRESLEDYHKTFQAKKKRGFTEAERNNLTRRVFQPHHLEPILDEVWKHHHEK